MQNLGGICPPAPPVVAHGPIRYCLLSFNDFMTNCPILISNYPIWLIAVNRMIVYN